MYGQQSVTDRSPLSLSGSPSLYCDEPGLPDSPTGHYVERYRGSVRSVDYPIHSSPGRFITLGLPEIERITVSPAEPLLGRIIKEIPITQQINLYSLIADVCPEGVRYRECPALYDMLTIITDTLIKARREKAVQYLQERLSPENFHLLTLTLNPGETTEPGQVSEKHPLISLVFLAKELAALLTETQNQLSFAFNIDRKYGPHFEQLRDLDKETLVEYYSEHTRTTLKQTARLRQQGMEIRKEEEEQIQAVSGTQGQPSSSQPASRRKKRASKPASAITRKRGLKQKPAKKAKAGLKTPLTISIQWPLPSTRQNTPGWLQPVSGPALISPGLEHTEDSDSTISANSPGSYPRGYSRSYPKYATTESDTESRATITCTPASTEAAGTIEKRPESLIVHIPRANLPEILSPTPAIVLKADSQPQSSASKTVTITQMHKLLEKMAPALFKHYQSAIVKSFIGGLPKIEQKALQQLKDGHQQTLLELPIHHLAHLFDELRKMLEQLPEDKWESFRRSLGSLTDTFYAAAGKPIIPLITELQKQPK